MVLLPDVSRRSRTKDLTADKLEALEAIVMDYLAKAQAILLSTQEDEHGDGHLARRPHHLDMSPGSSDSSSTGGGG